MATPGSALDLSEREPRFGLGKRRIRVRRQPPRRWGRYVAAGLGVLLALLALGLLPAARARTELVRARGAMEDGKRALLAGDVDAAERRFGDAAGSFVRARAHVANPIVRLAGAVPLLGRTPDAVRAMSEAGRDVAEAARTIAGALAELPGGLAALAPSDGRVPLEPLGRLAPPLERAATLARSAASTLEATRDSWLLGPVGPARELFDEELSALRARLDAAALLTRRMPAFLGASGTRTYFVGAANPAELRGTGGLIGAYAILTADDGALELSPFRPIQSLPNASEDDVPPPTKDYGLRYPAAQGFWLNINLTRDFPSAALAIENLYEHVEGTRLDGTIVADPQALQALMWVTGAVDVPALNRTLTPDDVVEVLSNQAYVTLTDPEARKAVLGDAAKAVLDRFLGGGAVPERAARALSGAASAGHLMVHSADPLMQRGLELAGASGSLLRAPGDYVSVVVNNGGGNKVDFYARRRIVHRVRLGAGGSARSEIGVEIENGAPAAGLPPYVIGPFPGASEAGENVSLVSVFVPESARVQAARMEGEPFEAGESGELGHIVLEGALRIPSGERGTMSLSLALPNAWRGSAARGVYRLTLQDQPTIVPTRVTLDVQAPEGTSIVRASPPMRINGRRAVWRGVPAPRQVLEVEFQKPLVPRVWDAITGFFSRKLIDL